jgi:hypothetical protein
MKPDECRDLFLGSFAWGLTTQLKHLPLGSLRRKRGSSVMRVKAREGAGYQKKNLLH